MIPESHVLFVPHYCNITNIIYVCMCVFVTVCLYLRELCACACVRVFVNI